MNGEIMNNTITIIGTMHHHSKVINPDTIYNKLCELKPDIILQEIPVDCDSFIIEWMQNCVKANNGNESTAVLKYVKSNSVILKAYDIKGLHEYTIKTRYMEKEQAFEAAYARYFKSGNVNSTALAYAKIMGKEEKIIGKCNQLSLEDMNSQFCDIVTEAFRKIQAASLTAIMDIVPELQPFKKGCLIRDRYQEKRNREMIKNILNYNQQYENKHLVVLCGYWHRYALLNILKKKQAKERFILKY
jgi:pheromone shutdown protein TraB